MNTNETVISPIEIQEGDILREHGLLLRVTHKNVDRVGEHGRVVQWGCDVLEDNNPKDDPLPSWAFERDANGHYDRTRYAVQGNEKAKIVKLNQD